MNVSFVVVLVALLLADRPDLVGRVVTSEGDPVPGAHALVDSASVREGASPLCPSSYADCRKSAVTDRTGRFRIGSVDPVEWRGMISPDAAKRRDAVARNSAYIEACAPLGPLNYFMLMLPETFPQQPARPVPLHRTTDFFGCHHPQPGYGTVRQSLPVGDQAAERQPLALQADPREIAALGQP